MREIETEREREGEEERIIKIYNNYYVITKIDEMFALEYVN